MKIHIRSLDEIYANLMTYADTVKRRAELRDKLGNERLTDLLAREVERRRLEATCRHIQMRARRMRATPWLLVNGRRI
ncbi:hypothetical protein [Pigmentiphaga daeguensis]|uniref:DUF465 domain-containing protein n=1 Tax=Pigmentiphaga daeguensis TaxID=414049 RepID=A0ABP3N057_9BURK